MSLSVTFNNVAKSFGPVEVLRGVSFALEPGRVVGLLGENGAGKSTLMKILAGYETASAGEIIVEGSSRHFANSRDAETMGIVLIHQEFNLVEHLTIAENIFLGHELRKGFFVDDAAMHGITRQLLLQVGLEAAPDTPVHHLIVAEKQLVEIAKAMQRNARLLIMDEPSATLSPSEAQRLFDLIAQLKLKGVSIIYISHKLEEVEKITDEVIVMRDGCLVTRRPTASLSRQQMANLMVGRELTDMFPPRLPPTPNAPALMNVERYTVPQWTHDVSFEVRAGEILGFAGLVGAGRTELFEGLLGLREGGQGKVELRGQSVQLRSPRHAARSGLTYLSEDRKGKGLHMYLDLAENLTLMALDQHAKPLLNPTSELQALQQTIGEFDIRTGDVHSRASSLSGGNQQKLAIARVLHPHPQIVVLDEPTRGVDVGAKRDIYFLIHKLASEGHAVIVISSELVELIGLAHRIIVMRNGKVMATLPTEHGVSEEELIAHATGTH